VAIHTTESICILVSPFGETSQIAHWITPRLGRVAGLIKGAFREKNRFEGNEDLLDMSRITLSTGKGGGLALLRERKLITSYPGLKARLDRFSGACLVLETIRAGIPEGERLPGLFTLLGKTLSALEHCGGERDIILFTYLGGVLKMMGFQPTLSCCTVCGRVPKGQAMLFVDPGRGGVVCRNCRSGMGQGTTISTDAAWVIERTPTVDPMKVREDRFDEAVKAELWSFFEVFLTYFLEKELKSFAFARGFRACGRRDLGGVDPIHGG